MIQKQKLIFGDSTELETLHCIRHTVPQMYLEIKCTGVDTGTLETIFSDEQKTGNITVYTPDGVWLNSYDAYTKLDYMHKDYNVTLQDAVAGRPAIDAVVNNAGETIREAVEAIPAVPAIVADVVTVVLLKQSDVERNIENLNIAMAAMMGV